MHLTPRQGRGFSFAGMLLFSLLTVRCGGGGSGSTVSPGAWAELQVNPTFTAQPIEGDPTTNPLRGYYRWRNQEQIPQSTPALDAYERYTWRDLEPREGVYDLVPLLADLAEARKRGQAFSFRIRMMRGYDDGQLYVPDYLVGHPSTKAGGGWWADEDPGTPGLTFVPDWNDPYLQQRATLLLQAIGNALGSTESIGWIDIGMFGQFGEWALSSRIDYSKAPSGIIPVTETSKRTYVDMHLRAFSGRQLVMFALYSNFEAINYATQVQTITSRPVGLRIDCLGRKGFMDQWLNHPTQWAAIQNQWQRAPFVAEFCGFGSGEATDTPATALQQVRDFHISAVGNGNLSPWASFTPMEQQTLLQIGREAGHRYRPEAASVTLSPQGLLTGFVRLRNDGNAPATEPWDVRLELVGTAGEVVWFLPLALDLSTLQGGGAAQTAPILGQLPALPRGTYPLRLVARDPRVANGTAAGRPALRWHLAGLGPGEGAPLAVLSSN